MKQLRAPVGEKYIQWRQYCWLLRIFESRTTGPKINKSFAHKKYGGEEKSLIAAQDFRDKWWQEQNEKTLNDKTNTMHKKAQKEAQ